MRGRAGFLRLQIGPGPLLGAARPCRPRALCPPPGGAGTGDAGRRRAGRARGGCGAPSSRLGRVTPPRPPPPGARAGPGRPLLTRPPRQAPAALKSRPLLLRAWPGSDCAPRSVPALCPQSGAESFLRQGRRKGTGGGRPRGPRARRGASLQRGGGLAPVWAPGGHVARLPGRRSGRGSASLTLRMGRTRRKARWPPAFGVIAGFLLSGRFRKACPDPSPPPPKLPSARHT